MIISLPHFRQSAPGLCLATCARMVLAGMGRMYSEAELDTAMGGFGTGIPSFAVQRLSQLDLEVAYGQWALPHLYEVLQRTIPVIAFVNTLFLDSWNIETAHAVVIVGVDAQSKFWIHDPEAWSGPTPISWDGFLAAWFEFDHRGATIQEKIRRNKRRHL